MKKDKISKFQKDVFNELINKYSFLVDEIILEGQTVWFAMKKLDEKNVYITVISEEDTASTINEFLEKYFLEKELIPTINNIILLKTNEENKKSIIKNPIRINISKREIIDYNEISKPIVIILQGILSRPVIKKKSLKEKFLEVNKETPIVTKCLLGINIWVFLVSIFVGTMISGGFIQNLIEVDSRVLYIIGAKVNYLILQEGELWRVIAHMFLHSGIIHLAFNMYALYFLGRNVENLLGKTKFIVIYLISGVVGCIFSIKFSQGLSVGASGAIFGLLGVMFIFAYLNRNKNSISKNYLRDIVFLIFMNLVIGLSSTGIDNAGHIGGLVAGVSIGYFILKKYLVKSVV